MFFFDLNFIFSKILCLVKDFEKVVRFKNLSTPYDYKSIMHYPEGAHSINPNKPTIKAIKSPFKISPSKVLSEIDIEEIRKLYNCKTDKKGLY